MSSFKNFASMLDGLQKQAEGTRTIAGSSIEDFLSIAGYEDYEGGGGGGFDIPTFTKLYEEYSCDMTYEEAKASYVATADSNGFGLAYNSGNSEEKAWAYDVLASGEMLSYFADIPETVNEGLALLGQDSMPVTLFADNGNFYYQENI